MRRKDREITDVHKIQEIIQSCACCRLGLNDQGKVYIVPLNFGYAREEGKDIFYFHGAGEGRKIDILRVNPYVGFEMDTNYLLHEHKQACGYSARFQSVIGNGTVSFLSDMEEKKHALNSIMQHQTGKKDWEYSEGMLKEVCVFKLEAEELSCKEHL